jgi:hypothetical protein
MITGIEGDDEGAGEFRGYLHDVGDGWKKKIRVSSLQSEAPTL